MLKCVAHLQSDRRRFICRTPHLGFYNRFGYIGNVTQENFLKIFARGCVVKYSHLTTVDEATLSIYLDLPLAWPSVRENEVHARSDRTIKQLSGTDPLPCQDIVVLPACVPTCTARALSIYRTSAVNIQIKITRSRAFGLFGGAIKRGEDATGNINGTIGKRYTNRITIF